MYVRANNSAVIDMRFPGGTSSVAPSDSAATSGWPSPGGLRGIPTLTAMDAWFPDQNEANWVLDEKIPAEFICHLLLVARFVARSFKEMLKRCIGASAERAA